MKKENIICKLFDIKYPIIQAGMVWVSGHKLASAVSNAGGLGIIGAGSMHPEVLQQHIQKCKAETNKPFAVNVPLLYPEIGEIIDIIIQEKVPIVFTSAGNPNIYTSMLKQHGIVVVHVVSSAKFALKAEQAGADAVVAEGFEAGGHNGREETTTMVLIPQVVDAVKIPVIAAGGIADGRSMLAAFALGAQAVQVGTRFALSVESSAHENFKQACIQAKEGDTILTLKSHTPVRLLKNEFYSKIASLDRQVASPEAYIELLGKGRAKKGIFEGDLVEGELEIGQVTSSIRQIISAKEIVDEMMRDFEIEINKFVG